MIESVREAVKHLPGMDGSLQRGENLSLLFARLCAGIDEKDNKETARKDAVLGRMEHGYSDATIQLYRHSMERRRTELERDPQTLCFEMELTSPMVVGMGEQNIHEFGITLQHPWGTPMIPGSGIKGVLSTFAHRNGDEQWRKSVFAEDGVAGEFSRIMFGGGDGEGRPNAGFLDFLDAWWVPRTKQPFKRDIITVHNVFYYQSKGAWPDGMAPPVPNGFITVAPGERFFFAVRGDEKWCALAKEMLAAVGQQNGFGAKTRVGYGRFTYLQDATEMAASVAAMDAEELAAFTDANGYPENLGDSFRRKTRELQYSDRLAKLFQDYAPCKAFAGKLAANPPTTWREVRNAYEQVRRSLPAQIDPSDPDVQHIFALCEPLAGDDQRNNPDLWLWKFVPKAADLLAGKTPEQICELLMEYDRQQPPLADFEAAINALDCAPESREEMLEYWQEAMEEQGR